MTKTAHANGALGDANGALGDTDASHTAQEAFKYPVVKDTVELIKHNKYTGFFVNRAASTLCTVASYATPVTAKFQDQIDAADRFVAQQVGNAGTYLPLLNKPTEEIVGDAKTYATSAAAMVDRSVAAPVRRTASSAYEKVQPYALAADAKLTPVNRACAHAIDTYMPSGGESESEEDVDSATQAFRFLMLSLKARRRLSRRVKAQLSSTATYTEKQIAQIRDSAVLLQKTTDTVNQLNMRLLELVLYAKENAVNLKDRAPKNPEELRAAITERFQSVVSHTEVISKYVRENAAQFPELMQERLHPMIDYFNNSFGSIVSEIQKSDADVVKKAYNIYKLTEQQTLPVLTAAKSEMSKTLQYVTVSVNNTAENAKAFVANTPVARSLGVTTN